MSRYDGMSRETMLDTVTGYTDDEVTEKMTDRTTAVDEFMKEAVEAVEKPTMPEPPAAPLAYVPVELLAKVIKKHGGVIQGAIPPFHKEWKDEFYQNLKK